MLKCKKWWNCKQTWIHENPMWLLVCEGKRGMGSILVSLSLFGVGVSNPSLFSHPHMKFPFDSMCQPYYVRITALVVNFKVWHTFQHNNANWRDHPILTQRLLQINHITGCSQTHTIPAMSWAESLSPARPSTCQLLSPLPRGTRDSLWLSPDQRGAPPLPHPSGTSEQPQSCWASSVWVSPTLLMTLH